MTAFAYALIPLMTPGEPGIRLPLVILFSAPIWAAAFAPLLLESITGAVRLARNAAYTSINGNHHTFHGQPLRFEEQDGVIWFDARDIELLLASSMTSQEKRLLGRELSKAAAGLRYKISERGLLALLAARTSDVNCPRHVIKLRQWIETQALPGMKKRG